MKNILYILLIGMLMFTITSCGDFMNLNPTTQPSETTFWKTENDFNMALAGIYGKLRSNDYYNALYALTDNLTDNSYDKNGCGSAQNICRGELDPSMGGYVPDIFNFSYSALARINNFIERAEENTSLRKEVKERMISEGKFFRAYHYMWLYFYYGDVPVLTRTLTMDEQYVPKVSAAEVYSQIMRDYDDAITGLPDITYAENRGHITQGAAKAFKAKLMLQHAYNKGIPNKDELKSIITLLESIKGYSLQEEYSDLFKNTAQESSPEIIFSIKNLAPASCSGLDMYYTNWLHTCPLRNLVDEFELKGEGEWKGSELAAKVNEEILNGPDETAAAKERAKLFLNRDKRLSATVFHSLKPFEELRSIAGETDFTGFGCYKYLQKDLAIAAKDLLDGSVSDQDMIHMRYGYVLLMIAEAENEVNGPTQKVYDAINAIRKRAGQNILPKNLLQDEMRQKIRHEWRVETAMEGLHYLEMKRWHTLGNITKIKDPKYKEYTPKFEEHFYLWPLPQGEIDKAGGILVQNPDYAK